jgi:hypothetical protein
LFAAAGLAAVLAAGFFVVFATGLVDGTGLLAAGLFTGALVPADFDVAGVALLPACDCPTAGLAAFCEDEGENLSLIFCRKDDCADALPTSVMAIKT